MAVEKLGHYSLTNPATIYDEQALTALELAGRTAAKVNENVDAFNKLENDTNKHLSDQDKFLARAVSEQNANIENMNDVTMPAKVAAEVQNHIENGDFDKQIDESLGNLNERLDNLFANVPEGSTTMDAEIIDARLAHDNTVYANLGTAIREQIKKANNYRGEVTELGYTSLSQCLDIGYYSVHTVNRSKLNDLPSGLTGSFTMDVRKVDNPDTSGATYPNLWYQHIRTKDGYEWLRFIGATVQAWTLINDPRNKYKYHGEVSKIGFTTIDQCREEGYYSIHRSELPKITDIPDGLATSCFIEVRVVNNPSTQIYPTMWYQIVRTMEGYEWQRWIGANTQAWTLINDAPESASYKYRGEMTDLGLTSFSQCTRNGYYSLHRSSLASITNAPADLTKSCFIDVHAYYNDVYAGTIIYQLITDIGGDSWYRQIGLGRDGAVVKEVEFTKVERSTNVTYSTPGNYGTTETIGSDVDTTAKVYALYDALVTKYPEYITKKVLGQNSLGTNINEYTFTSGAYNSQTVQRAKDDETAKPVVLILSGVHGYERAAVLSTYKFFEDMANYNEALAPLRENVTFKVIPVVTPYALDNNLRLNENNVNINRNFTTQWTLTATGQDYAGSAPADQRETQIVEKWLSDNSTAVMLIDHHNSGYTNEVSYLAANNETEGVSDLKTKFIKELSALKPYLVTARECASDLVFAYTGNFNSLANSTNHADTLGIIGLCLETSWEQNGTERHSATTNAIGAEVLGNTLLSFNIGG